MATCRYRSIMKRSSPPPPLAQNDDSGIDENSDELGVENEGCNHETCPSGWCRETQEYQLSDLTQLSTLGTGTFGRVVLAQHKTAKSYYALKILMISEIVRLKQIAHVKSEKDILNSIRHPFIVNMFWTHHDSRHLYMLLEFIPGGELFSYLRSARTFNNVTANFYSCEIISALEHLHGENIVYRDLKPENLLLDKRGHLKITDFGFAKRLSDRTWTLCGTPEYLAPEIIQNKGHNRGVDWWALGVLIFEMLVGFPPFFDENPFGIYQKILVGKIDFPRTVDAVAKDLIKKLLVQDRTRRLGCMRNGVDDVKRHRWFWPINWDDVLAQKLKAPIVPKLEGEGDTSNFESYPDEKHSRARNITSASILDTFKDF